MYFSDNVTLNSKSVNSNIDYALLPEDEMTRIGFRKVNTNGRECYYYCRMLTPDDHDGISFNVTLPIPHDADMLDIAVLDEEFLQPYDFQSMLQRNPDFTYALDVAEAFEEQMEYLQDQGVLSGHAYGEYV